MPTDATALLARLRLVCGNGAANVLRAIDEAGWAVVPKAAPDELRRDIAYLHEQLIAFGALRLPDGGEHG